MVIRHKQHYLPLIVFILGLTLFVSHAEPDPNPPLPLPIITQSTTQLLTNGGFEIDADGDKIPDGWSGRGTSVVNSDLQKCDKPTKSFAHSGKCAFVFRGNTSNLRSDLSQTITNFVALTDGSIITFSVFVNSSNSLIGHKFGKAIIKLSDNTNIKIELNLLGSLSYIEVKESKVLNLEKNEITKAKVKFFLKFQNGKFSVDDARFSVDSLAPTATHMIPTPDLQTKTITLTPTETATFLENQTDTQNATETAIETDASTSALTTTSLSPTNTPENTILPSPIIPTDTVIPSTNTPTSAYLPFTATPTSTSILFTNTPTNILIPTQFKLTANDGTAYDRFGIAVSLNGNTALVGAYTNNSYKKGAAYIYNYDGTTWTQTQKLTASDGIVGNYYGFSVALSGTTALIGAYGDNNAKGAVYVYNYDGTTWRQTQKLTANDGIPYDQFGRSVVLNGTTALISVMGDDDWKGSAYVFTYDGTTWRQTQKLVASDGIKDDRFSSSITLNGTTALIGAMGDDDWKGSAYVFTYDGTTWRQTQKLTANDGIAYDYFGNSTALSENTILIGAECDDSCQGAAYMYIYDGTNWKQTQKLIASDGASLEQFGRSLALRKNTALIGAESGNSAKEGAVYMYSYNGITWTQTQKLTANDGVRNDRFGGSISLNSEIALVGAYGDDQYKGSAYLFALP